MYLENEIRNGNCLNETLADVLNPIIEKIEKETEDLNK